MILLALIVLMRPFVPWWVTAPLFVLALALVARTAVRWVVRRPKTAAAERTS
jgi:hypothetical protein